MVQRRNSNPGRQHEVPIATVKLDENSEALSKALQKDLEPSFPISITAEIDMVTVTVPVMNLVQICTFLKTDDSYKFDYLCSVTVVDYEENEDRFEVVYHLVSLINRNKLALKVSVSASQPVVPSVISVWRASDWFEREGHDLFGIVFEGHPDLSPLLLYEGFDGYPGRKSFPFHDYQEW